MKKLLSSLLLIAVLVGTGFLYDFSRPKKAQATGIPVIEEFDIQGWIRFFQTEAQEITVDQVRKIVIEQITKKVIDKIIEGNAGGVAGGGSAFVRDYSHYIWDQAANDNGSFIDDEYDALFPSYIDPALKQDLKGIYNGSFDVVPNDCIDIDSISFDTDPDALNKVQKYLQFGCNNATAMALLRQQAALNYYAITQASQTELQANQGFANKDEDTNEIKKPGTIYDSAISGAIQAVYDVQTNNQSALSSIIGSFVDQLIDEIIDE